MEYDALKQPDRITHEYNMLMSSMHVSVGKHLLDPYFTVIWANDFFYEKTGYGREEYEATFHNHVSEYYSAFPDVYETMGKFIKTALKHGEPSYEFVCPMPVKGGSRIWIKVVGTFTKETVDGIPVIYSVFTDITDLVQAQTEKSITYDNLPGFIAKFQIRAGCAQERFTFLDANDRFIDFFGALAAGDAPYSLVNWDSARNQQALNEHYPAMREGKPVHFTVQAKTLQNDDAWLQLNGDCIDVIQGDPVYLFIYIDITDITEQRVLQKKLEERSELLRNALEMAERANRAKSDFLSRMSHDIRTPMNAIMGMLSIAKESWDDPDRVRDCLDKVENSARFLLALINDILDMSKIESGRLDVRANAFSLSNLVQNVFDVCRPMIIEKGHHLTMNISKVRHEGLYGDESRLQQVLVNILSNAVKYTPAGGRLHFSIEEKPTHAEGASVFYFTFEDDGIGMSEEFVGRIFEPFSRAEDSRISKIQGTGLGMAISQNIIHMMNGEITVDSTLGKGSRFTVSVALKFRDAEDGEPPVLTDLPVLVVDDERDVCEYASLLLKEVGMRAFGVLSGQEAVAEIVRAHEERDDYFAVILDWKMPDMDGLDTAREIRRRVGPDLPIIMLSGYDCSDVGADFLAAGVDVFIMKPLFKSNMVHLLRNFAEDRGCGHASVVPRPEGQRLDGLHVLLVEDNEINQEIAKELLLMEGASVDVADNGEQALNIFARSEEGYYQLTSPTTGNKRSTSLPGRRKGIISLS